MVEKQGTKKTPVANNGLQSKIYNWAAVIIIALITVFIFRPSLSNLFTNWDDVGYITNNPIIKDLSWKGIKDIFSSPVMGNYHPLTILSYAFEFAMVGTEPWLYHFDNLLLHLVSTCLVFWLALCLSTNMVRDSYRFKSLVIASVTALLFAIHPRQVETVAWASGRKDLMMALFYFGSCIAYTYYTNSKGKKQGFLYFLMLMLFVASVLSKAVAVTLPVTLLLLDYLLGRQWGKTLFMEKIPLFAIAIIFGVVAIKCQQGFVNGAIALPHFNILGRLSLASFALLSYLWKSILPINLSCFYNYPGETLPAFYYCSPLLVAALGFVLWRFFKRDTDRGLFKTSLAGSLFFLINILLLLQIVPVGNALVAERYSYIPYFGLFFIMGNLVYQLIQKASNNTIRYTIYGLGTIVFLFYGVKSYERCGVWYDSVSLWQNEVGNGGTPSPIAYNNLSAALFDKWYNAIDKYERRQAYQDAFQILNKTRELWPKDIGPYQGLAMLYISKGKYDSADVCFRVALAIEPTAASHCNYANFLVMVGKGDSAIAQYTIAINQNPDQYDAYLNRGKLYKLKYLWDDALQDFNTGLAANPQSAELYYQRSFCDTQKGLKPLALQDVERAISLGYGKVDSGYYVWLRRQ